MTGPDVLLAHLLERGFTFDLEDGVLFISPAERLSPSDRALINENSAALRQAVESACVEAMRMAGAQGDA